MWITIMEKFKKMASMSITFLRPRLSPKYCRIWTRTPRAPSNVTSSWPLSQGSARCSRISTTVGVRAQQLGPYSVFPQVVRVSHQSGQSHKGVKEGRQAPRGLTVRYPRVSADQHPTSPDPADRQEHLRPDYYLSSSGLEIYGKASIIFCSRMLQTSTGLSNQSHQIKAVASWISHKVNSFSENLNLYWKCCYFSASLDTVDTFPALEMKENDRVSGAWNFFQCI